jgi:Flp pilus assembly pilin Flp
MNGQMEKVTIFLQDEEGVVATEYLILLALLVGSTLLAVATTGQSLSNSWNSWADYYLVLADKAV